MELKELIFRSRARVVILVVVVVAAVVVSGAVALDAPRQYRARVAFVAPSVNRGSPAAIEQAVANVRAALPSDPVASAAAEAGGITVEEARDGLSLDQRGSSDTVEVVFTTEDASIAQEVVRAAAIRVMEEVTAVDVARATELVEDIEEEIDQIQGELDAFLEANNLQLPDEQYRTLSSELTALRVALVNAQIDGSSRVPALQAAVAEREAALADLAPKVRVYQDFQNALARAERRLESAMTAEETATGFREAVSGDSLIASDVTEVGRTSKVLRSAAGAGAVAALITLLLFAMLEFRRDQRRRRRAVTARVEGQATEAVARRDSAVAATGTDGERSGFERGSVPGAGARVG